MKSLNRDVAENFGKADRAHLTKSVVEKIRLGRNARAPVEGAGEEYGNYKKFEQPKSSVREVNDKGEKDLGYDTFQANLKKMALEMNNPD